MAGMCPSYFSRIVSLSLGSKRNKSACITVAKCIDTSTLVHFEGSFLGLVGWLVSGTGFVVNVSQLDTKHSSFQRDTI
jgi:hypothetical protein